MHAERPRCGPNKAAHSPSATDRTDSTRTIEASAYPAETAAFAGVRKGMRRMRQATPKQKALFFALAHDLGYDAELVKARAKERFGLTSFNNITTDQLGELIDRLRERQAQGGRGQVVDCSEPSDHVGPE